MFSPQSFAHVVICDASLKQVPVKPFRDRSGGAIHAVRPVEAAVQFELLCHMLVRQLHSPGHLILLRLLLRRVEMGLQFSMVTRECSTRMPGS
jgi:hypothetical protein